MSSLGKFEQDLDSLITDGENLTQKNFEDFKNEYEIWYSEAENTVKVLLPSRYNDFVFYYNNDTGKNCIKHEISKLIPNCGFGISHTSSSEKRSEAETTQTVNDLTNGARERSINWFKRQLAILKSVKKKFESSLFSIEQTLHADLFGSELEQAKHLNNLGFFRAAGAIASVVLEGHLKQICKNHNITIPKNKATINPITNELLKDILTLSQRKNIDYLATIRNKCDHKDAEKGDPTKKEIEELIDEVNKVIHTIF